MTPPGNYAERPVSSNQIASKAMKKRHKYDAPVPGRPLPTFTSGTAIAVIVGVVIGTGIFRLPSIVAAHADNPVQFILFWLAGGLLSLTGALCYSELSANHPDPGGEYYFISLTYRPIVSFLFNWGRMIVIQTGSIALVAFILGDYASLILNLGTYSPAIYAAGSVIFITALNISGTRYSQRTQFLMASLIVLTILTLSMAGLFAEGADQPVPVTSKAGNSSPHTGFTGAAMIFVMLTYGGWSEAAYLSGELINVRKNMVRVLVIALSIITLLYLMINLAYLRVLGFDELQQSQTIGADLTNRIFGSTGSLLVAAIVVLTAFSTINATIITGARTNYALGRDFRLFRRMGQWNRNHNTPINALLIQGAITLILIAAGAWSTKAIETLVDYTAPVFWFFLLLTTLTIFIFRKKERNKKNLFRIPGYPFMPLLFITACVLMLISSIIYTGKGSLAGVALLILGIPVYLLNKNVNISLIFKRKPL